MVNIYIKWINDPNKDFTINDVPERWRKKVEERLNENT